MHEILGCKHEHICSNLTKRVEEQWMGEHAVEQTSGLTHASYAYESRTPSMCATRFRVSTGLGHETLQVLERKPWNTHAHGQAQVRLRMNPSMQTFTM